MVGREHVVADDVADLVTSINAGWCLIRGVPFSAGKASKMNSLCLVGPEAAIVTQPTRNRAFADGHADIAKQAQQGGLGDIGVVAETERERANGGAEAAVIAIRQGGD